MEFKIMWANDITVVNIVMGKYGVECCYRHKSLCKVWCN